MVFYHKDVFNWIIPLSHNVYKFEFIIQLESWKFKQLNLFEGSDDWSKCTHTKKNSFSCFLLKLEHAVMCDMLGMRKCTPVQFSCIPHYFELEWRSQSLFSFYVTLFYFVWSRVSLCKPGWFWTPGNPPALVSWVGLQVWASMPNYVSLVFFFFFDRSSLRSSCSLCFLGLPTTHSNPLASTSHLLGLQVSANILLVFFYFSWVSVLYLHAHMYIMCISGACRSFGGKENLTL